MDLTESDHPHVVDIKHLSSPQLKIDSKTAVVQKNDGTVYFTGGFDESRSKSHNYVQSRNTAVRLRSAAGQHEPDGRHDSVQIFARNLHQRQVRVCTRRQKRHCGARKVFRKVRQHHQLLG